MLLAGILSVEFNELWLIDKDVLFRVICVADENALRDPIKVCKKLSPDSFIRVGRVTLKKCEVEERICKGF